MVTEGVPVSSPVIETAELPVGVTYEEPAPPPPLLPTSAAPPPPPP